MAFRGERGRLGLLGFFRIKRFFCPTKFREVGDVYNEDIGRANEILGITIMLNFLVKIGFELCKLVFLALGAVRRHLWLKFGVSGEALEALWETTLGHDRSFVPKSMSTAIAGGTTFFNQVLI